MYVCPTYVICPIFVPYNNTQAVSLFTARRDWGGQAR